MESSSNLKLNLGCGTKFIEGCVNVDVVPPQGPLPPNAAFVQDDIRGLNTFKENTAEQILAFHLIEHIPVYDIEPTLIRWHEVLRPGGVVIVEQPCLIKSCINFLQIVSTKDTNLVYNLGLKGIYGEPHPENTWMEHKWGWTFETLAQQFRNAGFVNIREEQPVTHMRSVRDFRLVAEKEKSTDNDEAK